LAVLQDAQRRSEKKSTEAESHRGESLIEGKYHRSDRRKSKGGKNEGSRSKRKIGPKGLSAKPILLHHSGRTLEKKTEDGEREKSGNKRRITAEAPRGGEAGGFWKWECSRRNMSRTGRDPSDLEIK